MSDSADAGRIEGATSHSRLHQGPGRRLGPLPRVGGFGREVVQHLRRRARPSSATGRGSRGAARGGRCDRGRQARRQCLRAQPGERTFPYHYEYGAEEWLLVRRRSADPACPGRRARASPGRRRLLREGPDGAHQVRNDSDEPIRVLIASTKQLPDAAVYPDSGKIGIWTGTTRPTRHGSSGSTACLLVGRRELSFRRRSAIREERIADRD